MFNSKLVLQKVDIEGRLDVASCKYLVTQENICKFEAEKKLCEESMDQKMARLKSHKDLLTTEIRELSSSLLQRCNSVTDLISAGDCSANDRETRVLSLLSKLIEAKEESIKEKEEELVCPVCLEVAEGEIYCCPGQHLVCSQCRPLVRDCPECRESYRGNTTRHRFAEKMTVELRRLRTELYQLRIEMENLS